MCRRSTRKKLWFLTMEQQHGLLVLAKPRGLSSAQCIGRVKRLGQKKIGHAGTLDPMAEGVLLVLLGAATKLSDHLMAGGQKIYSGTLCLGQTTDTWDAEGTVVETKPWEGVSEAFVRECVDAWQGTSMQEVPAYSAAKHNGKPLYALARAGHETPIKMKEVTITQAAMISIDLPFVSFRVSCSSGTYIRSLAHSLGIRCGCGAMLTALTREYSHPFGLDAAIALEELLQAPETLPSRVLPITAALDWPVLQADAALEKRVRNGMALPCSAFDACTPNKAILIGQAGDALALLERKEVSPEVFEQEWTVLRGLWTL